ncbi:hypothetical protein [Bifidobacterium oedipodis]|uniref:Toxin n=1 Tax=Bifidobacterium oedipodis TaxID=2675322 RepID=A0A7Y0ENU2_9BIFI|nr:hypothetical protein [Bifidobacterium sp. DSM 109957]NMM93651.1 hypothetical protein [Bifidobacterium sp. DSM 109957]
MVFNTRNTHRNTTRYTTDTRITIHPHAYKHGLTAEQIHSAYETGWRGAVIRWTDRDSDPPRKATIGFDAQLRCIELLYVELQDGRILVFHADYATKAFRKQIRKG